MFHTSNPYSAYLKSAAEISAEDRALIDAAIAKGKVTKVPMGACAAQNEFRWDGYKLALVAGPTYKAQADQLFRAGADKANAVRTAAKKQAQARFSEIIAALRSGKTKDEVITARVEMGEGRESVRKLVSRASLMMRQGQV